MISTLGQSLILGALITTGAGSILAFVAGELDGTEELAVAMHLGECRDCCESAAEYRAVELAVGECCADGVIRWNAFETPFGRMYNVPWGLRPQPPSHRHSLMEYHLSFTERPVADTLTALIADNVFGRFPRLRVLSVEYGASWVKPLLTKLDHIARLYSKDMWRFGQPPGTPSEMFRNNVWVAPFYEDDVVDLVATIGAAHVLNGSDYPHPEGLLWPIEFVDELEGLGSEEVRMVMRENFEGLVA